MRGLLFFVLCVGWAGCAASVTRDDGGMVGGDGGGCAPSSQPTCVSGTPGGVCGDAALQGVCVAGAWQCPSGTIPTSMCRCFGPAAPGCTCGASGWTCPDAGPPACPRTLPADGTPCSFEGQSCGSCSDPCSFCNIVRCESGRWSSLEVFPQPCVDSGTVGVTVACGPTLQCDRATQYCERGVSDIGGQPDSYACKALPARCGSEPSCAACFDAQLRVYCTELPSEGLRITFPGG